MKRRDLIHLIDSRGRARKSFEDLENALVRCGKELRRKKSTGS